MFAHILDLIQRRRSRLIHISIHKFNLSLFCFTASANLPTKGFLIPKKSKSRQKLTDNSLLIYFFPPLRSFTLSYTSHYLKLLFVLHLLSYMWGRPLLSHSIQDVPPRLLELESQRSFPSWLSAVHRGHLMLCYIRPEVARVSRSPIHLPLPVMQRRGVMTPAVNYSRRFLQQS